MLKIYRRILCREMNMGIQVVDLHKDGEGTIPNPVQTFEEAFAHHRKYVPSLHNDIFLLCRQFFVILQNNCNIFT